MKKISGAEEALVADVDREFRLADRLEALVLLDPLCRLLVVLGKLLDEIGAR